MIQKYLVFIFTICSLSCSARGPSFPKIPLEKPISIEGRYRFSLGLKLYYKNLKGELLLKKHRGKNKKTHFVMRTLGQNKNGAIRERSYEGLAYRINKNLMELRADRCYLFGKQDWEDRLVPLERWDCDHLFFTYRSKSNFKKREVLKAVKTKRTIYANWFSPTDLIPMPLPLHKTSLNKPIFFAGQMIHIEESPKTKLVIVWGRSAVKRLQDGQILISQDNQGRDIGKVKVITRPGNFVICRWLGKYSNKATIAYTKKAVFEGTSFF